MGGGGILQLYSRRNIHISTCFELVKAMAIFCLGLEMDRQVATGRNAANYSIRKVVWKDVESEVPQA